MSQKYNSIADCLLVETQLQSEQKWLELVLKLIAKERNSLEIERLELRSRLSQLNNEGEGSANERTGDSGVDLSVAVSVVNMMQNVASLKSRSQVLQQEIADKANSIEEAMKNEEELNLTAANSYLVEKNQQSQDEDEEEDELDLVVDMNILMNGDK